MAKGKLEKALLEFNQPLTEYGLSSDASKATKIYHTGVRQTKDPESRNQMYKAFEKEINPDVLAELRETLKNAAPDDSGV